MRLRFSLGIHPPKYHINQTGAWIATRLTVTLCRENLSLTGCSSAEPVSVSVQRAQNSNNFTKFTTCQKKQPLSLPSYLQHAEL